MVCTDTRMNRWPRTAFGQFTIPSNRTSSLPLVPERLPRLTAFTFREAEAGALRLVHEFFPRFVPPFFEVPFRALHETRFREPCKFHGRATAAPVGRKASFVPNSLEPLSSYRDPLSSLVSRFSRGLGYGYDSVLVANLPTLLLARALFTPVNVNNMFNVYTRNKRMHDEYSLKILLLTEKAPIN